MAGFRRPRDQQQTEQYSEDGKDLRHEAGARHRQVSDRQIAAERDDEDAERDEGGAGNVIGTKAVIACLSSRPAGLSIISRIPAHRTLRSGVPSCARHRCPRTWRNPADPYRRILSEIGDRGLELVRVRRLVERLAQIGDHGVGRALRARRCRPRDNIQYRSRVPSWSERRAAPSTAGARTSPAAASCRP